MHGQLVEAAHSNEVNSRSCKVVLATLAKIDKQTAHFLGLLLLHPMPGSLHNMAAKHLPADGRLHFLQVAGSLVSAPVACAGDEARRHVDGAAGEYFELAIVPAV